MAAVPEPEGTEPEPGRSEAGDRRTAAAGPESTQRRAPRVPKESVLLHRRYRYGPKEEAVPGRIVDISSGGMQIETGSVTYAVGDLVQIEAYLPGLDREKAGFFRPGAKPDRLSVLAVVRWKDDGPPPRAGVQWESIDLDHQRALAAYIDRSAVQAAEPEAPGPFTLEGRRVS